jgi:hypothetical protein
VTEPVNGLVSVNMRCPENGCGHLLALPAAMLQSEPASRGAIQMTISVTATTELHDHLSAHWPEPDDIDTPPR